MTYFEFPIKPLKIKPFIGAYKLNTCEDLSMFGERDTLDEILGDELPFIVDIGTIDGVDASNTNHLFMKGAPGILVEQDKECFARLARTYRDCNVSLFRGYATPDNVCGILKAANCPKEDFMLDLDIDSYDYYVLESILKEYQPKLMLVEINPCMPPPIRFAVKYPYQYTFPASIGNFLGMSISMMDDLTRPYGYNIIKLDTITAFLWKKPGISVEQAYKEGYIERRARRDEDISWTKIFEPSLSLPTDEGIEFIRSVFSPYYKDDQYVLRGD